MLATFAMPAAAENTQLSISIKDHVFAPAELKAPAGAVIELSVDNQDATPEEFESTDIGVEKVIPGKSVGKVKFGPLKAGSYRFVGEFNEKTAHGVLTVE